MTTRLFLIAPEVGEILPCARAACAAGDCATILVGGNTTRDVVVALQALNLAVILKDVEPRDVHHVKADGLLLSSFGSFVDARQSLKNESLGLLAGTSRHAAMEAAEAGADFVGFTQTKQYVGEPIVGWWQDLTDVPVVAFDPVSDALLKPQRPDFIRCDDAMWQSPEEASRIVTVLTAKWAT